MPLEPPRALGDPYAQRDDEDHNFWRGQATFRKAIDGRTGTVFVDAERL
jgi:hypothetical protein